MQRGDGLEPLALGHDQIGDHQFDSGVGEDRPAIGRLRHRVAAGKGEGLREHFAEQLVVVNEEEAGHGGKGRKPEGFSPNGGKRWGGVFEPVGYRKGLTAPTLARTATRVNQRTANSDLGVCPRFYHPPSLCSCAYRMSWALFSMPSLRNT